ncbi:MAG: hypothetical protein HRT44_00585 [Bdellovibrionales bacterium]|nr:hypothetical protein [Bdellovibrionales bacterium]NQZ17747.1 hypothetical protein [Bdellovibrionales bacterium]
MGNKLNNKWVAFLLIIFSAQSTYAQPSQTLRQIRRESTLRSGTSRVQTVDVRRHLVRELLGTDENALRWPSYPRVWVEKSLQSLKRSNTSVGFQSLVGGSVSIDYSYGVKTSVVILGSTRPTEGVVDLGDEEELAESIAENPLIPNEAEDMGFLRFDNVLRRTYPNPSEDHPMVGFCSYEVSLTIARDLEGKIKFPGFSQTIAFEEAESMSTAFYSNLFQVSSEPSLREYLEVTCNRYFRENVEGKVHKDFSKMVLEYFAYSHPDNECQPSTNDNSNDLGDFQCIEWHNQFDRGVRHLTAPRCRLQRNGIHKCELRAKEGSRCRMYYEDGEFSPRPRRNRLAPVATSRLHRNVTYGKCDQGLSCQFDEGREPTVFLKGVLFGGHAFCR